MNLAALATGTDANRFDADLAKRDEAIRDVVDGGKVLMIGGAGSIGSATLRALLHYSPRAVHVVDTDENGLAELARDLQGSGAIIPRDFRTIPLDYGSPIMARLMGDNGPYDAILNFAALKHVGSERDLCALLQLLDTNLLKQARFLGLLRDTGHAGRYFSVSTDKAVNPVGFMGASKRIMESMIFSWAPCCVTSARFANVAFSNGSLLYSCVKRLEKRQPITVPVGMARYFVSLEEAGAICLLASLTAPGGHLLIPSLDASKHLVLLTDVVRAFLRAHGLDPVEFNTEAEALAFEHDGRHWPVVLTSPDASMEKGFEEFVAEGEEPTDVGLSMLRGVRGDLVNDPWRIIPRLQAIVEGDETTKDELAELVASVLPNFHRASRA